MRKRNEQEYEERRQQILDGALQVFADKGFVQATNKDIAEAAGIGSPALLYHYFKDKEALLRAALEQHAPLLQIVAHPEDFMALPPEKALLQAGRAYLRMMQNPPMNSVIKLLFGEIIRQPKLANSFIEWGPRRALDFLTRYLQSQMESGVLRPIDPALAARIFIGPLVTVKISQILLPQPNALYVDADRLLETHIDVFLRGLHPENESGS